MLLADHGADVVKVERSDGGDDARTMPPHVAGESAPFMLWNRNKRSITLDRLGLSWATLRARNPRLIYGAISGFGRTGLLARALSPPACGRARQRCRKVNAIPSWTTRVRRDRVAVMASVAGILRLKAIFRQPVARSEGEMVSLVNGNGDDLLEAVRDLQRMAARPSRLQRVDQSHSQSVMDTLRQVREEGAGMESRMHRAIEAVCESVTVLAERLTALEDFVMGGARPTEDTSKHGS